MFDRGGQIALALEGIGSNWEGGKAGLLLMSPSSSKNTTLQGHQVIKCIAKHSQTSFELAVLAMQSDFYTCIFLLGRVMGIYGCEPRW